MRKGKRIEVTAALSALLLLGATALAAAPQTTAAPTAAKTSADSTPITLNEASLATAPAAAGKFAKDQLEQLVAPIALYSDSLLLQIMMAATYPIEIVEADRWVQANPGLKGTALEEALKKQDWDPTVKSLCTLPDVLKRMSENLDWTQDLGDAFLGQKDELLDTVQRMRGKANDSGNLKTTEQQVVTVTEEKIIVIESSSPEVVHVPSYSPTVVYGGWGYPGYYYPPMYPYYPPGAGLVTFGVGMAVGAAIWGNCNWGWGNNDVNIDVDRYNNFNRNTNINSERTNISNRQGQTNRQGQAGQTSRQGQGTARQGQGGGKAGWQHDASHRKGVNYQNSKVAGQYGGKSGSSRVSGDQARGYSGSGQRQARTPSTSAQNRSGQGSRSGSAGGDRSGSYSGDRSGSRGGSSSAGSAGGTRSGSYGGDRSGSRGGSSSAGSYGGSYGSSRGSAYSGSSSPGIDRAASSRGSSSRGTTSYGGSRSSGGGSRSYGGGGGSRGGGGGRRR